MEFFEKYLANGQMTLANLLLYNYRKLDLSDAEFILFLQLDSCLQKGLNPDLDQIAIKMGLKTSEVYELIHLLLEKKLLQISQVEIDGKKNDQYSFALLYKKLQVLEEQQIKLQTNLEEKNQKIEVFERFEAEFGRPLSSFEIQMLDEWKKQDNYSYEMINLALREAVLQRKINFKYIDKILDNWQNRGIKNATDLATYEQQRKGYNTKITLPNDAPPIPIYDWTSKGEINDVK